MRPPRKLHAVAPGITDEHLKIQMPRGAANPILNKLSAFLAPMSHLERVFSQPENDLDFSSILNNRKILIINLSKGILGDEPSRLLGGLIVASIQQAALARASIPAADRRDFYFYVDEFHNWIRPASRGLWRSP